MFPATSSTKNVFVVGKLFGTTPRFNIIREPVILSR